MTMENACMPHQKGSTRLGAWRLLHEQDLGHIVGLVLPDLLRPSENKSAWQHSSFVNVSCAVDQVRNPFLKLFSGEGAD